MPDSYETSEGKLDTAKRDAALLARYQEVRGPGGRLASLRARAHSLTQGCGLCVDGAGRAVQD